MSVLKYCIAFTAMTEQVQEILSLPKTQLLKTALSLFFQPYEEADLTFSYVLNDFTMNKYCYRIKTSL